MLKVTVTRLMQHLLAQNSWANALLQPYAGKSVQFNVSVVGSTLVILEDGKLSIAGETNTPDAIINIPPTTLLRLMTGDEAAKMQITMSGDTALATHMAKVLTNVKWDYEDDLSHVLGDIPAQKISALSKEIAASVKNTATNAADMLSEYWQEEHTLIAKKHHVVLFNAAVDDLRADVERFEKKFNKLSKSIKQNLKTPNTNHASSQDT